MKKNFVHIVFIVFGLAAGVARGQTAKANIDRDKILLGEQIQLILSIENAKKTSAWFNLPDSFNHFEVVERGKIDTLNIGKIINYRQKITITSFDSGVWQIPALAVRGIQKPTSLFTVEVLPVDVSALSDYHDIKEIIEVEEKTDWLFIMLIVVAVAILAGVLFWLYKRGKKKTPASMPLVSRQSALETALAGLKKLEQEKLYESDKVKEHYSKLVDISRIFFNATVGHSSLHKTTDEWMIQLQYIQVNTEDKTAFFQILRLADAVKFAKYRPPQNENDNSVKQVRQMLITVSDWYKNIRSLNQPGS